MYLFHGKKKLVVVLVAVMCMLTGCGRSEFTYKELENGTVCLLKYGGNDKGVTMPSEIDGKRVSAACASFKDNGTVTEVMIPDTMIDIEEGTFENAYNLTTISGGENVETIGWKAFENCYSLEKLPEFPKLKEIGIRAFSRCSNLETVPLFPNLKKIDSYGFTLCDLKSIELPEGLESIGKEAFNGAYELEEIIIPKSVTEIEYGALDNIERVKAQVEMIVTNEDNVIQCEVTGDGVWIPEEIDYIRYFFPAGDEKTMKKIYIPNSVQNIENLGLSQDWNLTVYIPSSVEYIGELKYSLSDEQKLCFVVEEGSYAENYAKENNIIYETVENVQEIYDSALEKE